MLQDLCHIPHQWLGLPVFGAGWMLILWAIVSALLLAYLWRRQGWNADTRSYLPLLLLMGLLIWLVLPRLEGVGDGGAVKGLPIRGYGVMLLLGVLAGVGLAIREARRVGLDPDMVVSLCFHLFVFGILGARLFYVIEYWEPRIRQPLPDGGVEVAERGEAPAGASHRRGPSLRRRRPAPATKPSVAAAPRSPAAEVPARDGAASRGAYPGNAASFSCARRRSP